MKHFRLASKINCAKALAFSDYRNAFN